MKPHTLSGQGALIANLPHILGRRPFDDVVVVGMSNRRVLAVVAAVSPDDCLLPELCASIASRISTRFDEEHVDWAVVVSWTELDITAGCAGADALVDALAAFSPSVECERWATDGRGYYPRDCQDPQCCSAGDSLASFPSLDFVHGAPPFARDSDDDVAPWTAPPPRAPEPAAASERRRASGAADRWWKRRDDNRVVWATDSVELCMAGPPHPDALAAGRILAGLRDVHVRDALIVWWLGGDPQLACGVAAGSPSPAVDALMHSVLHGEADPPDPCHLLYAQEWCHTLAAFARRREAAIPLTLLSVLEWWDARPDRAATYAQWAIQRNPEYSLARLVSEMCEAKLRPAWARGPQR